MAFATMTTHFMAEVGVTPRLARLTTTDSLDNILLTGYINQQIPPGQWPSAGDFVFVAYGADGENVFTTVSAGNAGVLTLIPYNSFIFQIENIEDDYTLGFADVGKVIVATSVSTSVVTFPNEENIPIGSVIYFNVADSGQIAFAADSPMTVNSVVGALIVTSGEGAIATAIKINSTTWMISGDIEAQA